MEPVIDRLARWVANEEDGNASDVDSRRGLLRRASRLGVGVIGAAAGLGFGQDADARRKKRNKSRRDDYHEHIGPGPSNPVWVPEGSQQISAAARVYAPCSSG